MLIFASSVFFFMVLTAFLTIAPSLVGLLTVAYMWTPALSSLIAYASWKRLRGVLGKPSASTLVLAIVLPYLHLFLLYVLFGDHWTDPSSALLLLRGKAVPLHELLLAALVFGSTVNALAALGEEIGWRGLMYAELRGGRLEKSFAIGTVWGLWHWPLLAFGHNFPESRLLGMLPFIAFTTSLTYVMLILRERNGVWSTAVLHGVVNGLGGVELLAFVTLPDYLRPPAGLLGAFVWALIGLALSLPPLLVKGRRGS
ncbi:MAG: CPBP family intramembrane metalloprotease [Crenarchaeota archaeon]|nr:CPBP family intramembrane metalloprotease [Thermoproteota archaeon]